MFTLKIVFSGTREYPLVEGPYDHCIQLVDSLKLFPMDVVSCEIWNTESGDTLYKWVSHNWSE